VTAVPRKILPPDPSPKAPGKHRPLIIHYWTEFQAGQQAAGTGQPAPQYCKIGW